MSFSISPDRMTNEELARFLRNTVKVKYEQNREYVEEAARRLERTTWIKEKK